MKKDILSRLPEGHPLRRTQERRDAQKALPRPKQKASKLQIKKALKAISKLNAFNTALTADTQDLWDTESKFSRTGDIAGVIKTALGYDDAQMDTFWASALAISRGNA